MQRHSVRFGGARPHQWVGNRRSTLREGNAQFVQRADILPRALI